MKIFENRQPLYHALEAERAIKALQNGILYPRSGQRTWPDGKRRFDDETDYDDSMWYKGWSMTRDISYAASWQDVIFVFDANALQQNFKIVPYHWGYSIRNSKNFKREREEFVVAGIDPRSLPKLRDEWNDLEYKDRIHYENFTDYYEKTSNVQKVLEINKYLLGFYISIKAFKNGSVYPSEVQINQLATHNKFIGFMGGTKFLRNPEPEELKYEKKYLAQLGKKYGKKIRRNV